MKSEEIKVAILGFGTVGQGFFELFNSKRDELSLGNVRVSEIIDLRYGHVKDPDANLISELDSLKPKGNVDVLDIIRKSDADVLCEFTWVNFKDGEPGYSHIRAALEKGMDVITTNKGPIALHYGELRDLALEKGKKLRIKGTVMAGTPSFNVMDLLPGSTVKSVRGIFNGTTNYILSRLDEGEDFDAALKNAQSKGYAEADPTNDVDGYDAAAKVAILSTLFGWERKFRDVEVEGIRTLKDAPDRKGFKLIGYADKNNAYVRAMKLDESDLLYHVTGVTNAIQFDTDTLGEVTVTGPGAGRLETAHAALTDLVDILRN